MHETSAVRLQTERNKLHVHEVNSSARAQPQISVENLPHGRYQRVPLYQLSLEHTVIYLSSAGSGEKVKQEGEAQSVNSLSWKPAHPRWILALWERWQSSHQPHQSWGISWETLPCWMLWSCIYPRTHSLELELVSALKLLHFIVIKQGQLPYHWFNLMKFKQV